MIRWRIIGILGLGVTIHIVFFNAFNANIVAEICFDVFLLLVLAIFEIRQSTIRKIESD